MTTAESTALTVAQREPAGSRAARRLRREGNVLGVVYGGGGSPISFQVQARALRQALAHAGAVLDLRIGDAAGSPVVVKELVRHPVTGDTVHVDFLRVRLDRTIETTVGLELIGTEDSPGVKDGGVLEHVTRELTIEALPNDIPDTWQHDVSQMQIGDTLTVDALTPPSGVKLLDDPELVIATLTPPRLQAEDTDEIEQETGVVGEGEEATGADAASGGEDGAQADSGAG
jgi:large subunit ribosomal protein L25